MFAPGKLDRGALDHALKAHQLERGEGDYRCLPGIEPTSEGTEAGIIEDGVAEELEPRVLEEIGDPRGRAPGEHGGLAWLAGPTGGYLAGYLVAAVVAGLFSRFRNILLTTLGSILGFILILGIGVLRLKALKGSEWMVALAGGVFPFIPGDAFKVVVAAILGWRLGPFMDRLREPKFTEPD